MSTRRTGPLRQGHRPHTALFESWRGLYSDSPRAISALLLESHPEIRQFWVAGPGTELPGGVTGVRRHSPEYFARLLSCDLVVANDIISKHLVKGPRSTYLQTWHGTALKTIGLDELTPQYPGAAAHRRRMLRDVRTWDLLLSPSDEATRIFRGAFGYRGQVLETGYPRNDVLQSAAAAEIRARVRADLGLAEHERAVLYAPTWRDGNLGPDGRFHDPGALDLQALRAGLGANTVMLMRMHRVVRSDPAFSLPGFTVDVTGHQDIAELYLAADVLVTDYSSAAFDFAVTGKPMVFFAHDLDSYSRTRGFYYDYAEWAPGEVVRTTAELAEALDALPELTERYRSRYESFVERFCPHEDGHATERVVGALLDTSVTPASSVSDR